MERINLPDTDSFEVMQQAVSLWLTSMVLDQDPRFRHAAEDFEEQMLAVYKRVYETLGKARAGK